MKALFLCVNKRHYLNRFNLNGIGIKQLDVAVDDATGQIHYLSGIKNQSYDYVFVAGDLIEHAHERSFSNWLRVLKIGGSLLLENNSLNREKIQTGLMNIDPFIQTVEALGNHTSAILKKNYALAPDNFLARAIYYESCGNMLEACRYYSLAISSAPDSIVVMQYVALFYERKHWLQQLNNFWDHTVKQLPLPPVPLLHALSVLSMGDYPRGFRLREAYAQKFMPMHRRSHAYPPPDDKWTSKRWHGEDLTGKTLVVWSEFGLGDEIMFAQLAYMFKHHFYVKEIIWVVQPPIFKLLKSHPDIDCVLDARDANDQLPKFDYWDFPHALLAHIDQPFQQLPQRHPYLFANQEKKAYFAKKLPQNNKRKIGLVWRGDGKHENDAFRSIHHVQQLDILLDIADVEWVCVQKILNDQEKQWVKNNQILNFGAEFNDFDDTAALLSQLDLLISVDTSVAHVAGALGVKTYVLLPIIYDWRWGLPNTQNLWYPNIQTIRPPTPLSTWKDILLELKQILLTK